MLSFCTVKNWFIEFFEMKNLIFRQTSIKEQIKKYKALQVRIPINVCCLLGRKRVSFSASLTVEAAMGLPLFLFAGVVLMMPFQIMNVERQVQAHVETVGEDISQMAYLTLGVDEFQKEEPRESVEQSRGQITDQITAFTYAEAAIRMKLKDLPVEKLSLLASSLLEDGETVDLVVDYEMRLPFSVFGLKSVKRRSRSYRRAWIGREQSYETDGEGNSLEEIVYIGRNSTRYHVSKQCHYLSNELIPIKSEKIEEYRSLDGRRYRPCANCGDERENDTEATVYIMKYGESYHTTRYCTAIQAHVTAVLKSQVAHLGACSYCSRKY